MNVKRGKWRKNNEYDEKGGGKKHQRDDNDDNVDDDEDGDDEGDDDEGDGDNEKLRMMTMSREWRVDRMTRMTTPKPTMMLELTMAV